MPGNEHQRRLHVEQEREARQLRMKELVDDVYALAGGMKAEKLVKEYAQLLFERTLAESTRLYGIRHFPQALEQDARQEVHILVWKKFVREELVERTQFEWEIFTDAGRIFQKLIAQRSSIPISRRGSKKVREYYLNRPDIDSGVNTQVSPEIIRYASLEEADSQPTEYDEDLVAQVALMRVWLAEFLKEKEVDVRVTEPVKQAFLEWFEDPDDVATEIAQGYQIDVEEIYRLKDHFVSWVLRQKSPLKSWHN
jgi:hypothetical protein